MKKALFALLAAVVMFSCGPGNEEKKGIRELLSTTFEFVNNQMAGMSVDEATVCDSCAFKNDRVYYYYTIDEDVLSISQLNQEKSVRKATIKYTIDNNPDMAVLVDMIDKLDGGFSYYYKGSITGEVVCIDIDY